MLLREIINLNESTMTTESALSQLISNTNSLAALYNGTLRDQVRNLYAEGLHEDMKRTVTTVVSRTKGRWFAENYASTSTYRNTPTQGLKNPLLSLSKVPIYQNARDLLIELGSLPMNAGNASFKNREGIEVSYSKNVDALGSLVDLLLKMSRLDSINKTRLEQCAIRLRSAISNFNNERERLHQEWEREWGKNAKPEPKQPKVSNNMGQQNQQANQLIDQILSEIPDKKVAHEIRLKVARSDNKMHTLQDEITKRGIKF